MLKCSRTRCEALTGRQSTEAEADNQPAAALHELPARVGAFVECCQRLGREYTFQRAHAFTSCAYRWMARIMRTLAWQRHKTPDIACRISGSVAFGFRSRNALAVRMTPLIQNPHCMACSSMNAF